MCVHFSFICKKLTDAINLNKVKINISDSRLNKLPLNVISEVISYIDRNFYVKLDF